MNLIEQQLSQTKQASYQLAALSSQQKDQALEKFAQLLEDNTPFLLEANQKDLDQQAGKISPSLYQRLKLDEGKLHQLVQGIRDVVHLPDPVGKKLSSLLLDEGLLLEKVTVPLGVVAIIFESRPDVLPQILSLILKSGNGVIFKGGSEAQHSNRAFMHLVEKLNQACPWLPLSWAQMVESRADIQEVLAYPQYVDLVIPRGSNELVQSVMAATKIPVLGHADGVCHLYVHPSAHLEDALPLIIDAKAQYPSACNALETLLIDKAIAQVFLPALVQGCDQAGINLKACPETLKLMPHLTPATESDWRAEYGDLTLAVKIVNHLEQAIEHINTYGSHHTDGILAEDWGAQETFLNRVDSAGVYVNASTRFADGFRYGFGAEIGISTAKTHARGPVGLEGLVIYKYKLRGHGHRVAPYTGSHAKPFLHQPLE